MTPLVRNEQRTQRDGEWMYGCQGGPRKEGDEEQWAQLLSWGDEKRMRWGYIEVVVAL